MELTEAARFGWRLHARAEAVEVTEAIATADRLLGRMGLVRSEDAAELTLQLTDEAGRGTGGYSLEIDPEKRWVRIGASGSEGFRCGIYQFLEALGVRWFSPADSPILPRLPVTLEPLRQSGEPSFAYRGLHICGPNHYDRPVAEWMSFLGMNRKLTHHEEVGMLGGELAALGLSPDTTVHSYAFWIPDGDHFADHPEWFSLVGGRRIRHREGGQLCVSNVQMREQLVRNVERFVNENPGVSVVGVCPNDGRGWCECDACAAMDTAEDRTHDAVNGRVARFLGAVCTQIAARCPHVKVGHYSYSNFRDFHHALVDAPANLLVSCTLSGRCFKHAIDDAACPVNLPLWRRLEQLKAKLGHVYVYDYYVHNWQHLPAPIGRTVAADFAAYHKLGIAGFLSEVNPAAAPSYQSFHLPLYLAGRILYGVDADVDAVMDDYCRKRFGGAAPAMRGYFEALEAGLARMDGCFTHDPGDFERMFTASVRRQAEGHLDQAAAAVEVREGAEDEAEDEAEAHRRVDDERKLFETWCRIADERPRYRIEQPIAPAAFDGLSIASDAAAEDRLVLLDKVTLLPPPRNQTFVSVHAEEGRIGFLIDCWEAAMDRLAVREGNTLSAVFGSDNVELFLAGDASDKELYHILINPAGYHCASACRGTRWNWSWSGGYRVETARFSDRWRVMFSIPRASVQSERAFSFTIARNRRIDGRNEITGTPGGGVFFARSKYLIAE